MRRAHEIKNEAAAKFNCKPSEIIFSICLKTAHAEAKVNVEYKGTRRIHGGVEHTVEINGHTLLFLVRDCGKLILEAGQNGIVFPRKDGTVYRGDVCGEMAEVELEALYGVDYRQLGWSAVYNR